jgi:hypothetical protein
LIPIIRGVSFLSKWAGSIPVIQVAKNDQFFADYQAGILDIHDYVKFATEAVRSEGARVGRKGAPSIHARGDFACINLLL